MNKFNNKSGFTLIEIIVVMIIIGILAAIALPNLFNNVTRSKGTTAVAAMDGIKSQLEACAAQNNTQVNSGAGYSCNPAAYNLPYSNGFTFLISTATVSQGSSTGATVASGGYPSAGNLNYSIVATDGSNTISITRSTNGVFTCSAPNAGPYQGVC